jgi:signal transduction histidine kinase
MTLETDTDKKILDKLNRDIKQQRETIKKLEKELEQKNRRLEELEKTNRELQKKMDESPGKEGTEKAFQEEFLQAQKMESLGRLAAGVAHDFNNLLTAILGYSQLLLEKLPSNSPLKRELNIIFETGEKGASLVRKLLALSRKQELEIKLINLNDVVENLAGILPRMLGADMEMDIRTADSLGNIMADLNQVEQVIINLAVNARDAMPSGGWLIIETADVNLDEAFCKYNEGIEPGHYAVLTVTDTGKGMSREEQEKIFEPFFTTKEKGKGTGLGLATVHGIVTQHGGYISVYSESGVGTTFKIYFKVAKGVVRKPEIIQSAVMPRGFETVLVVDDDPGVISLVTDTLQPLGYNVLEADGGGEALEIGRDTPGRIDLLLTDVIMPGMNGGELRNRFKDFHPESGVVFMSGYIDDVVVQHIGAAPGTVFLQKPFSPTLLANQIRKVLDAPMVEGA